MKILIMKVTLRASWVHSLKEKRMVTKSIIQKLKNKFNISVGEVDEQDIHQTIVIGVAGICGTTGILHSTKEKIITFIEENSEGEIVRIEYDEEQY